MNALLRAADYHNVMTVVEKEKHMNYWKMLENLPTAKGHTGRMMVHQFRQCTSKDKWEIIFCSDFGYTEPIYGETALEAVKNGIEFLNGS